MTQLVARPAQPDTTVDTRRWSGWWVYLGVAVLAFAVRVTPVLIGAGFYSSSRYDDSVYYAAADALTYGRVPYRDFVLLHPPGIALALTPFVLLGRVTSDHVGMMAGQLAFMLIGAANAVLVALIARRWGWAAAVTGGLLYACWQTAVYAEQATLMEPLATMLILGALLLLLSVGRRSNRRHLVAGALLGASLTLKIWYVAPFVLIVAWTAFAHRRGDVLRMLAGTGAVAVVVLVPFFVLAPHRMYDMVVRDQLARPSGAGSKLLRLPSILGAPTFVASHSPHLHTVTVGIEVMLALAAVGCLIRGSNAWALLLLLVATGGVLLSCPAYFGHYAELTAAPVVLVLAVGLTGLVKRRRGWNRDGQRLVVVAAVLVAGWGSVHVARVPAGRAQNWSRLAAAVPPGCLASDNPEVLIGTDRLSSDLAAGCAVPVDVGGLGYNLLERVHGRLQYVSRAINPAWQQFLYDYLTGARTFVLQRGRGEIMPAFYDRLIAHPVLAHVGGLVLRAGDAVSVAGQRRGDQ